MLMQDLITGEGDSIEKENVNKTDFIHSHSNCQTHILSSTTAYVTTKHCVL